LKRQVPDLVYVGAGYSYLQQWLPNVAQSAIRSGLVDLVGLGRMGLAYPDMPSDVLAGKPLQRKKICLTCGLCATAPNLALISGCYSLDDFYKGRPEYQKLKQARNNKTGKGGVDSQGVSLRL
jgi:NADPH2 dehydrogenase